MQIFPTKVNLILQKSASISENDFLLWNMRGLIRKFVFDKGQAISKINFDVVNSSKKRTLKFQFLPQPTEAEIFRSFFGRIEKTKYPFEIN